MKSSDFPVPPSLPNSFQTADASPNPFVESLTIQYQVATKSTVDLIVYDLMGNPVAHLVNQQSQEAGQHQVNLNSDHLPAGIYLYHLRIGGEQCQGKIIRR